MDKKLDRRLTVHGVYDMLYWNADSAGVNPEIRKDIKMNAEGYSEMKAPQEPEVQMLLDMLGKVLEEHDIAVGSLSARLVPVLQSATQVQEPDAETTPSRACDVSERIQNRIDSVVHATRRILDIEKRLQI